MLLPSFFVVGMDQYENPPDIPLPANAYFSFKLNAFDARAIDSFYKKIFLSPPKHSFCILIDLDELFTISNGELKKTIEVFISLTFHINYIKIASGKPLVLFETRKSNAENLISTIIGAFKNQGYDDVEIILLNENMNRSKETERQICFNLQESFASLFSHYVDSIKQLDSSNSIFFFFLAKLGELPEILNILEKAETDVRENFPQVYNLVNENMSLKINERDLHAHFVLMQEQLDSLSNYHLYNNLSESRYKRQIKELLRFYKNEYEILPTWYKRFGHIVKVIAGKRTLRSLFNDNVKKYKD
jgi:hypothetical protein